MCFQTTFSVCFWTPSGSKIGSVHPFVLPSFLLSVQAFSWNRISSFSKFGRGARNPNEVWRDRAGFPRKNYFPPKLGKWTKDGSETGFFEFIEKCGQ